jgi:hypothetical protein
MTPAERALLLDLASRINACRDWSDRPHLLKLIVAVEAEADARLPLGEPCRSCTGHIRENNPLRCTECSPTVHQNYERREDR